MGFQTPLYELSDYLNWTTSGRIQLPDFQREYKWEDQRIRSLLATVVRGHPLGVVMLLKSGNDQVRFKPKPIAGADVAEGTDPRLLLLDGQQRLTSLTQALTGDGVVSTMDDRGKKIQRKYYIHVATALEGEERIDDAVRSLPADGVVRTNFGRDIELDVSTPEKEREHGYFPMCLLFSDDGFSWLLNMADKAQAQSFNARVITGDKKHFDAHGTDFRLNDNWQETQQLFADHPVLAGLENTDFLQAVTLLTTRKRNIADTSAKPAGVSAKREDVLKLTLDDYLEWVGPLREAFLWTSTFLADRHIFDTRFLPYPKQVVPLAAIKVVMGGDADLLGPRKQLVRWFWSGILGELYGGAIETRFVRDLEQVPDWAMEKEGADVPRTIQDATFVESRLHSLRTRNAAAYKGIYSLLLAHEARDWMEDKALDKVQYASLTVDIHHVFPKHWCTTNGVDDERRESIVNKTAISARTNRTIGGTAPSRYLAALETKAQIPPTRLDGFLESHLVSASALRNDDFDAFFADRRERLCQLIERAMGKPVPRDVDAGHATEDSGQFEDEAEDVDVLIEA